MTVVCVPDAEAVQLLGDLPEGVEVVVWNGEPERPARLAETEIWVPQVEDSTDLENKLSAMPDLKVIQMLSAGVEDVVGNVPDGVQLCDARGVHGGPVSELVLAMILATFRQIPHFVQAQERGTWDAVQGDDLIDKRVLVVGAGDLGEQTAKRLRGFDAEPVLVAHSARDGVHATSELPDLLPDADVVVLTVPLTPDTEGMVDAAFLAALPDGALVVNVARGKVIDTAALLAELTSQRLRAALDVVDPEPLPDGHPLWTAPNLLITPHAGGSVKRSGSRAYALVRSQIERFLEGDELENVVTGAY
ncbi:MAG: 2-hydroxyacid dehydrogenase [Janthinobacterium lividum]